MNVFECDRCKKLRRPKRVKVCVSDPVSSLTPLKFERQYELCDYCAHKLKEFLEENDE